MKDYKNLIPQGTTFILSEGGRDGGVVGVLKARLDINIHDAEKLYLESIGAPDALYMSMFGFMVWLVEKDYIDQLVQFPEWRIRRTGIPAGEIILHGQVPR